MPFDPKAYLAESGSPKSSAGASGGFDPKTYLAGDDKPWFGPGGSVPEWMNESPNAKALAKGTLDLLPVAGGVAGAAVGGTGGTLAGPAGTMVGGVAGAGLGAGMGKSAQNMGEHYLLGEGKSAEDQLLEPAEVGLQGATMEGAGQMVMPAIGAAKNIANQALEGTSLATYGKKAADLAGTAIKKGVAKTSSFLSGAPSDAVERLIERPSEVLGANNPRSALTAAETARNELMARNSTEGQAISGARKKFASDFGDQSVDTRPILDKQSEFLTQKSPVNGEQGALSPEQLSSLSDLSKNRLTSQVPGAYDEKTVATKTGRELQNFADYLDSEIKSFDQSKLPGSGDTPYQSRLRRLYGEVKSQLHDLDPEGLGAADKRFSQYANDVSDLGRLENEGTMEGFINNFYGRNKTGMRESADRVIPESIDSIKDIAANRAFDISGPAGHGRGLRNMLSAAMGTGGVATHNPYLAVAGAALQPSVHKQVIGRGAQAVQAMTDGRLFQAIQKNPSLVQSISNPRLRQFFEEALGGSGQMAPAFGELDRDSSTPSNYPEPPEAAQKKFLEGN